MSKLMNNWGKIKFGDYFQILSGYGFQKSEYSEDGVRLLRIDNVGYGKIQWSSVAFLPTHYTSKYPDLVLKENDILLALNRPVTNNRLKIARLSAEDVPSILYQRVGKILLLTDKVFNDFLFYLLQYHLYFFVLRYAIGSDQPYISLRELYTYELVLPPLPEQRAIAAILGTWDRAIALTERRLAAAEQRKKALMQQLLTGQVRFPEFAGEAWREVTLKKMAKLTAGGTPSTKISEYWNGNIRWMKSGEVHLKRVYEVEERITQAGLDNSSAKLIPENSVLIALAGQGVTRGKVAINKVVLSTNQSIAAMMPNSDTLYYEYLFQNLDARYAELRRLSSGEGGRGGLNLKLLGDLKIPLPSLPEQRRIAAVLNACDREIDLLRRKRDALQRQKQGLMQRLLTGRVRVSPAEEVNEQ